MSKKYVATIMNRCYIGEDKYVFSCMNAIVGTYDEDSQTFTDANGNEYFYMMSEDALCTEIPYSYFNLIAVDEIKKTMKTDKTVKEAICEYEDLCKSLLYYIGFTKEYIPFLYVLNLDSLEKEAVERFSGEQEMPNDLSKLIIDAIDGKYTKEELVEIVDRLKTMQDDIENTVGTIETKVEAIENNKSFSDQLRENLANPPKVQTKPVRKVTITPKEEKVEIKEEIVEKKEEKKKNTNKINIDEVKEKVTKVVIAQDEAADRLITEIARKELNELKKREAILITGSTGVGKTELIRQIAKNINRPLYKVDSTQITTPGYVGLDIEQVLWDAYVKFGRDKEKTEHAIIYFDEIDKKGSKENRDVNGRGVLHTLLTFIEGTTYNAAPDSKVNSPSIKIDTSNMTVIFGGAFTDVFKNLKETNTIGFNSEKSSLSKPKYRKAEAKDFVEYGMMTDEFMGRVTVIKLNDLEVEDLKRVMLEGEESAKKIQEEIFEKIGVKLTFTSGFVDKVAQKAYDKKTGARGLNGIIDESTWRAFEEVYKNEGLYEEVIITEDTVEDNTNYQLVKKKNKK